MPKTIALLTGGTSSEREVALASAEYVIEALKPYYSLKFFDFPKDLERFLNKRDDIQAVIPLFHGRGGEDGSIQGFLETLGIPFVFSEGPVHALALNKHWTKAVVKEHGVQTPNGYVYHANEAIPAFTRPSVIKPLDAGSSIGVTIAKDAAGFVSGIKTGTQYSHTLLIEDYITGREFTVAVVEDQRETIALPVIEIRSKNEFFDLQSKYDPSLVDELCPAPIDEELSSQLKALAIKAHEAIGAKHLSRSDFIVDDHGIAWFLEINTIPGQTKNSLLPKAIRATEKDLYKLYQGWIDSVSE